MSVKTVEDVQYNHTKTNVIAVASLPISNILKHRPAHAYVINVQLAHAPSPCKVGIYLAKGAVSKGEGAKRYNMASIFTALKRRQGARLASMLTSELCICRREME